MQSGVKIWVEISRESLTNNFLVQRRMLRQEEAGAGTEAELLAVIKADAYGHGIDPCAAILARAGANWLGVTDVHEGALARKTLRAGGIDDAAQPEILVMCGASGLHDEAEKTIRHSLTPVVWTVSHLAQLAAASRRTSPNSSLKIHIEIDSGMSRQGVTPGKDLEKLLQALTSHPALQLDGVLTHFTSTEVACSPETVMQQQRFQEAVEQVKAFNFMPRWVHAGNSSFLDNSDKHSIPWLRELAASVHARPMVRSGIALYGYVLPIEGEGKPSTATELLPTMSWKTRIIGLRTISAGTAVGYNCTYVAAAEMRLALLPAGYADGLRRELSSASGPGAKPAGWVVIRNRRAPIIGRVSMNLTTVDVSGIPGVEEGDEVVLLGRGVTANDHARLAGTIPYEILCGVKSGDRIVCS